MVEFDQIIALSLAQPKSTEQFTKKKPLGKEKGSMLDQICAKGSKNVKRCAKDSVEILMFSSFFS